MKYTINIKAADFKDGLFGTGFFGEDFSSVEELKTIFREYGPKKNVVTKITISSAETTSAIKDFGNNLAAKGQNINLFSLAVIARKDKFKDITIEPLYTEAEQLPDSEFTTPVNKNTVLGL